MKNVLAIGLHVLSKSPKTHVYNEHHWSHYLLPKRTSLSLWCFVGGAKVRSPLLVQWRCLYNQWSDPSPPLWLFDYSHDCSTSLWLFDFYMTLHILYMSFGLPLYNTFSNKNLHNPQNDVAYHDSWHDMTLITRTSLWHGNVKPFLLLLVVCLLENDLFSTSISLRDEEPSVLLGLELWSQIDVPLISPNRSTCIFSYQGVF